MVSSFDPQREISVKGLVNADLRARLTLGEAFELECDWKFHSSGLALCALLATRP